LWPNGLGDRVAYVTAVYDARIVEGDPVPSDGELSEIGWFAREELPGLTISRFARAVLTATGYLRGY
jgi:NADH pyrophosphatase NudC (nudix superfamily)